MFVFLLSPVSSIKTFELDTTEQYTATGKTEAANHKQEKIQHFVFFI